MKKILLLLANGFETYEASVFIDVFGWNLIDGDGSTELFSCGLNKEINTSFGQRIIVDYLAEEIDCLAFDALAVPGGFEEYDYYQDAYDERFLNIIRMFKKMDKPVASVCVGALPIAKSGILHNKNATTYSKKEIRLETLRGFGAQVIHKPIVIDDNIITSWDPSTATEVAFILLEILTSKENANKIRHLMGFDRKS